MSALKPITHDSIPRAIEKAERYRLLNEPFQAESICRDVLAVEPANQAALICLILALTDTFSQPGDSGTGTHVEDAQSLARRLVSPYDRLYYDGVIKERWALSLLQAGHPPSSVYDFFHSAMGRFEEARLVAPTANDDAILRWNTCVRIMERYRIEPSEADNDQTLSLDDDVPPRR